MKPIDVKTSTHIKYGDENNDKEHKAKLVIMKEYQNIKIFLPKVTLKLAQKMFLSLGKLKILYWDIRYL